MDELPDLKPFENRLAELAAMMAEPGFYANARKAAELTREEQKLRKLLEDFKAHEAAGRELAEVAAMSRDPKADPALKELAAGEAADLERRRTELKAAILEAVVPPDPADSRDTVMEIRAGTGGEEAALFAAELVRLYQKYADAKGWKIQPMSTSLSERGGCKEAIFLVSGTDVYKELKYESGVHRVQRVPVTEANGRIHTSTVTVAVLPEAEEVEVQIDPADLEITVSRASGPGGQGVNTTDSAVQIVHKPTGLLVSCADERSQIKNKARALTVLRARLLRRKEEEERAKYAAARRSQIGSGDRSERIRTYNFPQNRVTDHRIGFTIHNLPAVLEGGLSPLIAELQRADHDDKLAALSGAPAPVRRRAEADE